MSTNHLTGCTISSHHCDCFSKLTNEEQQLLESKSVIIKYNKGEVICKQGGFASHILFIQEGLAKVYLDNGQNSLVLKIIPPGNLLGISSINEENNTFQYSAMAYIDSEIKQVDINFFKELLSRNAEFAKEVINVLISNSIQINGRFFCLTHKQSYGRLADILVCLADRIFKAKKFELNMTRKDLAELSGISLETVVRILKKFKEEELIHMDGNQFEILDYNRLLRISETG